MSFAQLPLVLTLLVGFSLTGAGRAAENVSDTVIFRKPLADGQELVVAKGPLRSAAAMKQFVQSEYVNRLRDCFTLSVELRSNQPAIVLWSKLYWNGDGFHERVQVVDFLAAPGRLIFATSEAGRTPNVYLRQIGLIDEPDREVRLPDCSEIATLVPPGELSVKLSYDEEHKRVEAEVIHRVDDFQLRSVFQEQGEAREFVRVSRQESKVPATMPSTSESKPE